MNTLPITFHDQIVIFVTAIGEFAGKLTEAAYAKTFAADTATWAASEAVQIFGGMGYSTEFPVPSALA